MSGAVDNVLEEGHAEAQEVTPQMMLWLLQNATRQSSMEQNRDQEAVRVRLMKVFGESWGSLQWDTVNTLIKADSYLSEGRLGDDEDCSGPAMLYQKALELEVTERIVKPFRRFLLEKHVETWVIGTTPPFQVQNLTTQSLAKVKQMFSDWRSVLEQSQPGRVRSPQSVAYEYHGVTPYLAKLTQAQRHLILDDLTQLLDWMLPLTKKAKHTASVNCRSVEELRHRLLGAPQNPGLLPKLAQLLPLQQSAD